MKKKYIIVLGVALVLTSIVSALFPIKKYYSTFDSKVEITLERYEELNTKGKGDRTLKEVELNVPYIFITFILSIGVGLLISETDFIKNKRRREDTAEQTKNKIKKADLKQNVFGFFMKFKRKIVTTISILLIFVGIAGIFVIQFENIKKRVKHVFVSPLDKTYSYFDNDGEYYKIERGRVPEFKNDMPNAVNIDKYYNNGDVERKMFLNPDDGKYYSVEAWRVDEFKSKYPNAIEMVKLGNTYFKESLQKYILLFFILSFVSGVVIFIREMFIKRKNKKHKYLKEEKDSKLNNETSSNQGVKDLKIDTLRIAEQKQVNEQEKKQPESESNIEKKKNDKIKELLSDDFQKKKEKFYNNLRKYRIWNNVGFAFMLLWSLAVALIGFSLLENLKMSANPNPTDVAILEVGSFIVLIVLAVFRVLSKNRFWSILSEKDLKEKYDSCERLEKLKDYEIVFSIILYVAFIIVGSTVNGNVIFYFLFGMVIPLVFFIVKHISLRFTKKMKLCLYSETLS